jgi:DNA processing protein
MIYDCLSFSCLYISCIKRLEYFKKFRNRLIKRSSFEEYFGREKADKFLEIIENNRTNIEKLKLQVENKQLRVIDWFSDEYPQRLKQIPDAPPFIFVRGDVSLLYRNSIVGMVGARKTDDYGRRAAEEISTRISYNNITVVSGLAAGIDSICHEGSIDNAGGTIAVTAVDSSGFPALNRKLFEKIILKGATVSEYPSFVEVRPEMFIIRNRIIAGLADSVLVLRATLKSGSLWTAEFALNYDRDVMAVPGNIYENLSSGTNILIKRGAVAVFDYKDVLEYINVDEISVEEKNEILSDINVSEKKVFSILDKKEMYIDDIIISSKIPGHEVMRILNQFVFKGLAKKIPGNRFYKCN